MNPFVLPTLQIKNKAQKTTILPLTGPYLIHALSSPLTVLDTLSTDETLLYSQKGKAAFCVCVSQLKELITESTQPIPISEVPSIISKSLTIAKHTHPDGIFILKPTPLPNLPAILTIHTSLLTEMLTCLLKNAAQSYTHTLKKTVTLTYSYTPNMLSISVSDQGCGMNWWQKSICLKPTISFKKDGHGFGLATCNQAAKAIGGKIQINSKPSQGTHITLCLPIYT